VSWLLCQESGGDLLCCYSYLKFEKRKIGLIWSDFVAPYILHPHFCNDFLFPGCVEAKVYFRVDSHIIRQPNVNEYVAAPGSIATYAFGYPPVTRAVYVNAVDGAVASAPMVRSPARAHRFSVNCAGAA
jgi:hypothetical protein